MTFIQARKTVFVMLIAIIVTALLGQIFMDKLMVPFFIILVSLLVALFYITVKYFKCPHCGSGFGLRFPVTATHCPFCGEKFE